MNKIKPISLYTKSEIEGIDFWRVSLLVDNNARNILVSDCPQELEIANIPAPSIGVIHISVDSHPACIQSRAENKSVYIMSKRK